MRNEGEKLIAQILKASIRGVTKRQLNVYSVVCIFCMAIILLMPGFVVNPRDAVLIIIITVVLLVYISVAKRFLEDADQMNLQFRLPKIEEKVFINTQMDMLSQAYQREYGLLTCLVSCVGVGMLSCCFYHLLTGNGLNLAYILIPGILGTAIIYILWRSTQNKKLNQICNGEYCIAEAVLEEKYVVVSRTARSHYKYYFLILNDRVGNKGKFQIPEHVFHAVVEGDNMYLVSWNNGKGFYNDMEPVMLKNVSYNFDDN